MVNNTGIALAHRRRLGRAQLEICKALIEGSERAQPPPFSDGIDLTMGEENRIYMQKVEDCLTEAYGNDCYSRHTVRLIRQYASDGTFLAGMYGFCVAQNGLLVATQLHQIDLLLEAHEVMLSDQIYAPVRIGPDTRLIDLLRRRDRYGPVTAHQSFFIFGQRIDQGHILWSYDEVLTQLTGEKRNFVMEYSHEAVTKDMLYLILTAIRHLTNS